MTVKDCIHQFMHFVASLSTFSKICWLISLTAFVITIACVIYVGCAANANSSLISNSVVADSQNGEKLKFYENKKSHYAILREYWKRQRLLVILFVIADIFTCLSVILMIFNFANIITATLLIFLDLLLINVIDKNELKLKELRKIEKTIKMIQ